MPLGNGVSHRNTKIYKYLFYKENINLSVSSMAVFT